MRGTPPKPLIPRKARSIPRKSRSPYAPGSLSRAGTSRAATDPIGGTGADTGKTPGQTPAADRPNEGQAVSSDTRGEGDISRSISSNLSRIGEILGESDDVVIREFKVGEENGTRCFILFIDGLADKTIINENLLESLLFPRRPFGRDVMKWILERVLSVGEIEEAKTFEAVVRSVLSGDTALFVDGSSVAVVINTRGWKQRSIEEPVTEPLVTGPREGFVETLRVNTALIRRRIVSPNLRFESMRIGAVTRTNVTIAYVKEIVNQKALDEVRGRLSRVKVDELHGSTHLQELIEDAPSSMFDTVFRTERPDKVAANLLEGRVAILVDGTPIALTVPRLFLEGMSSSEDYYTRYWYSTAVRWLRYLGLIVSLFLPALYVAVLTYHPEMLPTRLLVSMAAAREGVPFPTFVEVLLMGTFFEGLREAGVRLPKPIGVAVSIVGALVLGQAAISAGLAGAGSVIVTAITAIAVFTIPAQDLANATMPVRFAFLVMGAVLGLFGLLLALIVLLLHTASLESFGIPYLSPVTPFKAPDMKDVFIRAPWTHMTKRPESIRPSKPVRQSRPGDSP